MNHYAVFNTITEQLANYSQVADATANIKRHYVLLIIFSSSTASSTSSAHVQQRKIYTRN